MDCLQCKLSYDNNAKFCQNCGNELGSLKRESSSEIKNDLKYLTYFAILDVAVMIFWFFSKHLLWFLNFLGNTSVVNSIPTFITIAIFGLLITKIKTQKIKNLLLICFGIKLFLLIFTFLQGGFI